MTSTRQATVIDVAQHIADSLERVSARRKENIGIVLESYGDKGPQHLCRLSRSEEPWLKAAAGFPWWERSRPLNEISDDAVATYYAGLID